MKILSIDVGVVNLALCLFEVSDETREPRLLFWDIFNISLRATQPKTADKPRCGHPQCHFYATYHSVSLGDVMYCKKHASKDTRRAIPVERHHHVSMLPGMTIKELAPLVKQHAPSRFAPNQKKEELCAALKEWAEARYYDAVAAAPPKKTKKRGSTSGKEGPEPLFDIGRQIPRVLDPALAPFGVIDRVIIENQIGPLAIRMKTVQGMLTQYFVMSPQYAVQLVQDISAKNKLKSSTAAFSTAESAETGTTPHPSKVMTKGEFLSDNESDVFGEEESETECEIAEDASGELKTDRQQYVTRKKESVRRCQLWLKTVPSFRAFSDFFETHRKKDDLADAFLQGIWYLESVCGMSCL